jgi:hypothetical protein
MMEADNPLIPEYNMGSQTESTAEAKPLLEDSPVSKNSTEPGSNILEHDIAKPRRIVTRGKIL